MYYSQQQLQDFGLKIGQNVSIHHTVQFFGKNIEIGSNVRIDCFSVISANQPVVIGNNVHLGVATHIFGAAGVWIEDYCGISSRVSIFSTSDDYSEGFLTNPTIAAQYRKVVAKSVIMKKHVVVGCGSIIMPGVTLAEGASVGAGSFVTKNIPAYMIVSGNPVRKIGMRNQERLQELEKQHRMEVIDEKQK